MSDVSLEKNLQEYNKKLIDFNLAIISHLKKNKEYNSLLDTIVTQFSLLFDFDIGHFYAYDSYQDQLKSSNIFYLKSAHKHKVFVQVTKKSAFKKGSGLPGSAWEKRKVIYCPDITQSKNFPRTHKTKASLNIKGGIALPVFYDDKLLGVAEFFSIQKLTLSHDEMVLFERFSTLINGLYGQYQEHRTLNLILENCGEGIYGLDNKGMTTFVNPPACKMLGYTEAELIGCSMHEKIHYAYPDKRPYLRDFCKVYECISLCKSFYVDDEVFWTKEGKPLPIEYTVTPIIENKNTLGAVVTFIDISEKRKVKSHLKFISELQARYISALNRNTLFDDILDYLIECTESKYGFIGAVLKDKKDKPFLKTYAITNIAWNKKMQQLYEQSILLNGGIEFRNLKTLFGYTLRTGNVVISNDPNHDKRAGGLPKGHPALDNYLGIPIFSSEGDLVAMYGFSNRKAGYSQEIVDDLEILTRAISSMIESSHQYKIIQEMARLDPLTNIYNRQYFDIALNQALETHHEKKQSFCILMLGLDKFKNINDTYGHQISDAILVLFAKRIKKILKKDDIIARLGGDEFICILHNTNNNTYTHNLTHRILKAGETAYKIQGKSIYCGVTIGIVYYPEGGKTAATLLKHVDFSLYDAKKNKHKWQVYSKGIDTQYLSLLKLEKTLEDAFLNESFYLSYQPQIELKTHLTHRPLPRS